MNQTSLLSSDHHQTAKTQAPDLYAVAAQKLHDMPASWQPLRYEVKESPYGKFYQITGAVPLRYLTKGKRKGKPVWPPKKDCQIFTFTPQQIEKVTLEWETENNCCSHCGGDGQGFAGWSKADGTRYRTCRRCHGTGRPAPSLPYSVPRCRGVGYNEDGVLEWREGCETCLRRTAAPHPDPSQQQWIEPPPIIAFWCEFLIEEHDAR